MRRTGPRFLISILALAAFLVASWAGAAHAAAVGDEACHGPAHETAHDHGAPGAPKAPAHDHDGCALCRVAACAPILAALPAPLPVPEVAFSTEVVRPADAPRPAAPRLSLARGPPASTPA